MENWAEMRRLHRSERLGVKTIARRLGVARNTVRAALASDEPPKYQRRAAGSAVDGFEPQIRRLLAEFPDMPATVIAERVGWEQSASVLRARVAELRSIVSAGGPGGSHRVRGRGDRAVRSVVSPENRAGRCGETR